MTLARSSQVSSNKFPSYKYHSKILAVEQAVLSGNIIGMISNLLGGISEAEIEGFLENISSGAIEMAMNCECL